MPKLFKFKENVSPIIVQAINKRWPDLYIPNLSISSLLKATKTIIYVKSFSKRKLNIKLVNLVSHCKKSYINVTKNLVHSTAAQQHTNKAKIEFERRVLSLVPISTHLRTSEEAKIRNLILNSIKSKKKSHKKQGALNSGIHARTKISQIYTNLFIYQTVLQNSAAAQYVPDESKTKVTYPFFLPQKGYKYKYKLQDIIRLLLLLNIVKNLWISNQPKVQKSQIRIKKVIKPVIKSLSIIKEKTNNTLLILNQKQGAAANKNAAQRSTLISEHKKKIKAKALAIAYSNYVKKYVACGSSAHHIFKNPFSSNSLYKNSVLLNNQKNFLKTLFPFNIEEITHNTYSYNFKKQGALRAQKNLNIYSILESFFYSMSSLISKPVFINSPLQLKILLFFYWLPLPKKQSKNLRRDKKNPKSPVLKWKDNIYSLLKKKRLMKYQLRKLRTSKSFSNFFFFNKNKLEKILIYLNKFFKKPIEMELIRLHHPHFDSNILINLIGFLISIYKFRYIWNILINFARIKNPTKMFRKKKRKFRPSYVSGINFKLAGRIDSKSLKSRAKSKLYHRGSLARGKANIVTFSRFTHKNKVGAYSITLNTGHLIVD